jgi:hypothetical protein
LAKPYEPNQSAGTGIPAAMQTARRQLAHKRPSGSESCEHKSHLRLIGVG